MDPHLSTELAYKNGYKAGYLDGSKASQYEEDRPRFDLALFFFFLLFGVGCMFCAIILGNNYSPAFYLLFVPCALCAAGAAYIYQNNALDWPSFFDNFDDFDHFSY